MGKKSRDKGGRGEREVAELLRAIFPEARRRFSSEESQGVVLGRDLNGVEPLIVQCELAAHPRIANKMAEAIGATERPSDIPVAFTRRSSPRRSDDWLVTMRATDFLRLASVFMRAWREERKREREQGDPWCFTCASYHAKGVCS